MSVQLGFRHIKIEDDYQTRWAVAGARGAVEFRAQTDASIRVIDEERTAL